MSIAVILDFAGGTRAQYDEVISAMGLHGQMSPGGEFHVAGRFADGWRVIDIWESAERFERFRDDQIVPHTASVGLSPTRVRTVDVDDEMPDDGRAPGFVQCVIMPGLDRGGFRRLHDQAVPGGRRPEGLTCHINGPWRSGWCVIDTWVSQEARDTFMARTRPIIERAPLSGPPRIEEMAVEAVMHSAAGVRT